jgi:GNAT superfamily N-acetyltransferase
MTSPDQLIPGRPPPEPMEMQRGRPSLRITTCFDLYQDWNSAPLDVAARGAVGGRLVASGREGMDCEGARRGGRDDRAESRGGRRGRDRGGGFIPEFVGKGFGGHLLTLAARLTWEAEHQDGGTTRREWLHTSSLDHPNALCNYHRRGFRASATENEHKASSKARANREP